jgi:hypothetical protein
LNSHLEGLRVFWQVRMMWLHLAVFCLFPANGTLNLRSLAKGAVIMKEGGLTGMLQNNVPNCLGIPKPKPIETS